MKNTRVHDRIWLATAVRACCVLLMLAQWAVLGTTVEASESTLKTATESGEYRLMPGDKLGVLVFEQKDLSGDFAINGAGEIMLPLAGTAKVAGLTLEEARQLIEERLSDGILVHPTVSARIVEFRPIFVTGRVKRPGNYPFIAGMSVKAAIATAGGEGVPEERLSEAVAAAIMAEERVRVLETDRLALFVRKARLEHQRDEVPNFNMPQLVGFGIGNAKFTSVYAAENETFVTLVETYNKQLMALEKQGPRIEAEIQAVNAQIDDVKQRLEIVSEHLAEYEDYGKRGYVRKPLVIEQQIQKSAVQAELSSLQAQLARLRQNMGDLEIRKEDVKASYKRQILSELQDTSQRLLNIDATLGTARKLRYFRAEKTGFGAEEAKYAVRVTRTRPDDVTAFDATDDTKLEPGDVVEIKRVQNELESLPSTDAALEQLSSSGNFASAEGQQEAAASQRMAGADLVARAIVPKGIFWTVEIGYGRILPLISASAKIEKPTTALLDSVAPKAYRSEAVKDIQHTLVALGHSLTVDGVLGPITMAAIEDALANVQYQSAERPADVRGANLLASRMQE